MEQENITIKVLTQLAIFLFATALCLACFLESAVADNAGPTTDLKVYIQTVTALLEEHKSDEKGRADSYQAIFEAAERGIDFRETSRRCLGRYWQKLSEQQQQEFVAHFHRFLGSVYLSRIDLYNDQEILYTKERIRGTRAEVHTEVKEKGATFPVSYIMISRDGRWRIYDVVVEGVSLVRNYREQFQQHLKNDSMASLIERLDQKTDELQILMPPQ